MAKFCGNCGTELKDNHKHCGQCGWEALSSDAEINSDNETKSTDNIKNTGYDTTTPSEHAKYNTVGPGGWFHDKTAVTGMSGNNSQTGENAFKQFSRQMTDDSYNERNRNSGKFLWVGIALILVIGIVGFLIKYF